MSQIIDKYLDTEQEESALNIRIDEFEEGSFPRKLYFVVNRKL